MIRREFLKSAGVTGAGIIAMGFELGCDTPVWVITAQGIAAVGVNIADELIGAVDPALKPFADAVLKGFTAVNQTLTDIEAALKANAPDATLLQNLATVFSTLRVDAQNLLSNLPGSGSAADAIVTAIIALIAEAVSNIGSLIAPALPATSRRWRAYKGFPAPNGWKGKDFKSRFNDIVKGQPQYHTI